MANNISVAIIGAAGIGRVHVREFIRAGAEVVGILCSTPESTQQQASKLSKEFSVPLRVFKTFEDILIAGVQAVSICTPPETHLSMLEQALKAGLYVFCEKPLFWCNDMTERAIQATVSKIAAIGTGRLAVNTSNAWFLEAYRQQVGRREVPTSLDFGFHTQGPYRNRDIGIDLLPHGLSILLESGATGDVANLVKDVEENRFCCRFDIGITQCTFDFHQGPRIDKKLTFTLDGHTIERVQKINDGDFAVYLKSDEFEGGEMRVSDPFCVYINRFVQTVAAGRKNSGQQEVMFRNMELMAHILNDERVPK